MDEADDILLAKAGDQAAIDRVWVAAMPACGRVARRYCKLYPWIDPDDLAADLAIRIPHFVTMFDPSDQSKTDWAKYLYFRLSFYAKDVLRREDPLGIGWPQKNPYPEWYRLGDKPFENFDSKAPNVDWDAIDASLDGEVTNGDLRATLQTIAPERFTLNGKNFRSVRNGKKIKFPPGKKRKNKKMMEPNIGLSEIMPPAIPEFPDEPLPPPAAKRKRKPGPKPGSKAKPRPAKPKQAANATPTVTVLSLALRFVDAAGGLANARNLLRQIGEIRK